jgi:hypothetical protein
MYVCLCNALTDGQVKQAAAILVAQADPWQAFFRKDVPHRLKSGGVIERTNMNMYFG